MSIVITIPPQTQTQLTDNQLLMSTKITCMPFITEYMQKLFQLGWNLLYGRRSREYKNYQILHCCSIAPNVFVAFTNTILKQNCM